jgi:deazaflavin-dependent oxidoreductase (nitroreductase family)
MTMTDQQAETMRQFFKNFNRFMLLMWRLGLGRWINYSPEYGGRIMVITHTGRKSGLKRHTPVNYSPIDGDIYCTAGFGHLSDWYRNLLAHPEVEVWLPDGWWAGVAEDVSESDQRIPLLKQIIIDSGFAGRMAGLDAYNMTDEAFDAATKVYRLIRIQRTEARTGAGGPGEWAWIWPLATMILLPLVLLRRKR